MTVSSDWVIVGLSVALALVATAGIATLWQQWQEATIRQRRALVREAARWIVESAELLHPIPGSGPVKLQWVLDRLARRFPEFDESMLERQVESAVWALNDSKATAAGAYLNGKGPRHG